MERKRLQSFVVFWPGFNMNVRQKLQLATSVSVVRLSHWYPGLLRFRVIFYIQIKQSIGFCDSVSGVTMESTAVLIRNTGGLSFLETSFCDSHFASLSY